VTGRRSPQDEPVPDPEQPGGGRASWPTFWFEEPPSERDETRVTTTREEPATETPPAAAGNGAESPTVQLDEPAAPASPTPNGARVAPESPPPARPPIAGPVEAFVRRPLLVLLPLVVLIGAAIWIGLARDPVYTAEARINVGRADVAPFVLQNVVAGNAALAASYARVIATERVIDDASRRSDVSPGETFERLDASPIPGSTLIQVEATGPDEREAVSLANAGARALIAYVTKINRSRTTRAAFRRYRRAQAEVQRAQERVIVLRQRGAGARDELAAALVDYEAARLRASNLANVYRGTTGDPTGGSPLRLIAPAATADSDRGTTLQRLILIGAAAGLVLGLGIALLVANRARLRALRE
jgi:hypothetical protein